VLKNEYPLDRSVSEEGVEEYLLSLKAVGLIELASAIRDTNGKPKLYYKITDYGASRLKYIS
jgi:DNA-binding PadR family transcriptional regulator